MKIYNKMSCGFCKSNKVISLDDKKEHMFLLALTFACENCGATWEVQEYGKVFLICEPQIDYIKLTNNKFEVSDLLGGLINKKKKGD